MTLGQKDRIEEELNRVQRKLEKTEKAVERATKNGNADHVRIGETYCAMYRSKINAIVWTLEELGYYTSIRFTGGEKHYTVVSDDGYEEKGDNDL